MNDKLDRQMSSTGALPEDPVGRKNVPMVTGLLDYFPYALAAVAHTSWVGNDQHNPGEKLHWAREKSTDHADCILRHLVDRGKTDTDGVLHSAKMAWRALALLQLELEVIANRPLTRTPATKITCQINETEDMDDQHPINPCPW